MGVSYRPDNPFAQPANTYSPDNPFVPKTASRPVTSNPLDFRQQRESTGVAGSAGKATPAPTIRDVLLAVGNGATASFADEALGAIDATNKSIPSWVPLMGGQDAPLSDWGKNYQATKSMVEGEIKASAKAHPTTALLGNIAGGLLPAVASGGGSLTAQLGLKGIPAMMAEGAAYGGLQGVGSGNGLKDRTLEGLGGALFGAGTAGVLGLAGAAGKAGYKTIRSAMTAPEVKIGQETDRILAAAVMGDGGLNLVRGNAAADKAAGYQVPVLATSGGGALNDAAYMAANVPSPNQKVLTDALKASQAQERPMLQASLEDAAGVGTKTPYAAGKALDNQQSQTANRLFTIARDQPPIQDAMIAQTIAGEPELINVLGRTLKAQGANATPGDLAAYEQIKTLATGGSGAPPNVLYENVLKASGGDPAKAAAAMQQLGESVPNGSAGSGEIPTLSVKTLHKMKQGTRDLVTALRNSGGKNETFTTMDAQRITGAMHQIVDRLGENAPSYGAANTVFANDAGRRAALDAGAAAFTKGPEELADVMAGTVPHTPDANYPQPLLPQNTEDYLRGAMGDRSQKMADMAKQELPKYTKEVFGAGTARDQTAALLGEEGMSQFQPALNAGKRIEDTNQRVFGGSSTIKNANVMGAAPGNAQAALEAQDMLRSVLMSPKRTLLAFVGRMNAAEQTNFRTSVASELAKRLALDPTGAAGQELLSRLEGVISRQDRNVIAVQALKQAQLWRAAGTAASAGAGALHQGGAR